MDALKKAFANLIKIKSLVTIAVIAVFSVLSFKGIIDGDDVMNVVLMVVAFYFGTQHERKAVAANGD